VARSANRTDLRERRGRRGAWRRVSLTAAVCGCFVCLVLSAATVLSMRYHATLAGHPYWFSVQLADGRLRGMWLTGGSGFGNPGWQVVPRSRWGLALTPQAHLTGMIRFITVPLWMPLAAIGGPTLLAARIWWRLRSLSSGCPSCGYSRAGLGATHPCPECGWMAWKAWVRLIGRAAGRAIVSAAH
jgi:hypothetical protein